MLVKRYCKQTFGKKCIRPKSRNFSAGLPANIQAKWICLADHLSAEYQVVEILYHLNVVTEVTEWAHMAPAPTHPTSG